MTSLGHSSSSWISHAKVGLTLAFLVCQITGQAAPNEPAPPDPSALGPVVVTTNTGKNPDTHRKVKRGPVKPDEYPTKPQQQVQSLR